MHWQMFVANVYWLYGRCCCQLCLILCHQSDVINWWSVVLLLPLLGWLMLLPCGDVVPTVIDCLGWCYCQCCGWCYCHFCFNWQMLCQMLYHSYICCWRHYCASGRCYSHYWFKFGWCYCKVADGIATIDTENSRSTALYKTNLV